MTQSPVYFTPTTGGESMESVAKKAARLFMAADFGSLIPESGLIGIVQHVGEGQGIGFVKPEVTRALAEQIRNHHGKPFLLGTTTLYTGNRSNAVDHLAQAYDHGFTPDAIGCPIIIADGLRGTDRRSIEVPRARHGKNAYLASAAAIADALIVVSHPTGHGQVGLAATLKNIAMGLASRSGKLAMHHGAEPRFLPDECTACGVCAERCPVQAIEVDDVAKIIEGRCIGCGQCFTECRYGAIAFDWSAGGSTIHERVCEYCLAAKNALEGRLGCINVAIHYTSGCDCGGSKQNAICEDLGIVASKDPVATDTATADLLIERIGRDVAQEASPRVHYRFMLEYAERIGAGSRSYSIQEIRG